MSTEILLEDVVSMDLKNPISKFDSTERNYVVNMTVLMTLEQFYQLAMFMQKSNSGIADEQPNYEYTTLEGYKINDNN